MLYARSQYNGICFCWRIMIMSSGPMRMPVINSALRQFRYMCIIVWGDRCIHNDNKYLHEFISQRLAAVSNLVHVVVPHAMSVLQVAAPRTFTTLLSILTTMYINSWIHFVTVFACILNSIWSRISFFACFRQWRSYFSGHGQTMWNLVPFACGIWLKIHFGESQK